MKFIKGFMDYRFLLNELVKKGIRLKYRRSYLGILWSLLEPILTTIVLVIVFGELFNRGPEFPVYIIVGRLTYSFFQSGTKGALTAIRKNAGMIKKVYVPKYLYPLSSVLFNFIIFAISLIVIVFTFIYSILNGAEIAITWNILWWIPCLAILLVLTIGVGLILCTLNVFFRDIEYLWNVGLMLIMYMSAIFYPAEKFIDSSFGFLLKFNPLFQIIDVSRSAWMGYDINYLGILYAAVVAFVSLVVGLIVFRKNQDKFILHI